MFGVRARSASKPTTSIKSFNYYLTRVEELESEMMSMNVREIFNIVKCCIVREISWMRNWWPRRSSHLIKPKPDLTLRRRGYQYIIWLGLVKNTNETFMNSYMNNKLWLIHSNLMLMLTQLTSEKFWVRTPRTSFKISKVKTRLQTNVFDGFWYFLTKKNHFWLKNWVFDNVKGSAWEVKWSIRSILVVDSISFLTLRWTFFR